MLHLWTRAIYKSEYKLLASPILRHGGIYNDKEVFNGISKSRKFGPRMSKSRPKSNEQQARLKELEQKHRAEMRIVDIVRGIEACPWNELPALLRSSRDRLGHACPASPARRKEETYFKKSPYAGAYALPFLDAWDSPFPPLTRAERRGPRVCPLGGLTCDPACPWSSPKEPKPFTPRARGHLAGQPTETPPPRRKSFSSHHHGGGGGFSTCRYPAAGDAEECVFLNGRHPWRPGWPMRRTEPHRIRIKVSPPAWADRARTTMSPTG